MVGACKAGHAYWLVKIAGGCAPNEHLKGVLERGPFEIAEELDKKAKAREAEERQ